MTLPLCKRDEEHEDWQPSASMDRLRLRAALLRRCREFFDERGVLEVETPHVSSAATTDPHIESLTLRGRSARFLRTSPELAMKRMLAAGAPDIYELGRVFRAGECGRFHNPEFTLLEWYRTGWDHHRLMDEVDALVRALLAGRFEVGPRVTLTYREAFETHCGVDPFSAEIDALRRAAAAVSEPPDLGDDRDGWLELVFSTAVAPRLDKSRLVFVHGYPASQAALAAIDTNDPAYAQRFEAFLGGLELANGFNELGCASEQRARFERDGEARRRRGQPDAPLDRRFLSALERGSLDAAGVAVGFDRIVMLAAGAASLDEVMAFDWQRA